MKVNELFDKKLGFGAMRLPEKDGAIDVCQVKEMVDLFLEKGFKYFDTAYPYHGGRSETTLRECLVERYPRESFMLADKMPVWEVKEYSDYQRIFNEQLRRCGVEYFDLYLLHALGNNSYNATDKLGGFDFLRKLKEEGKVRFGGFSFHDNAEVLDRMLTEHPEVDFVQLQINYIDWTNPQVQSREIYEVALKHNKPVIVMEPVKGGTLATLVHEAGQHFDALGTGASYASYAIRYAASLSNVMVVLSGMSNMNQAADNIGYMENFVPLSEEERLAVKNAAHALSMVEAIPCTACRYCVDDCPKRIPIPDIFKIYNDIRNTGDGFVKDRYNDTVRNRGKAGDCVKCGKCEGHCPQHIEIRAQLEKMAEIFES